MTLAERLDAHTYYDPNTGCWLWVGYRDKKGYGRIHFGKHSESHLVHRVGYELERGPIPDGMELDHLCRQPACWSPYHLEPVTHRVNCQRGVCGAVNAARQLAMTVCKRGHPLVEVRYNKNGTAQRWCHVCHNLTRRAWRLQRQQAGMVVT